MKALNYNRVVCGFIVVKVWLDLVLNAHLHDGWGAFSSETAFNLMMIVFSLGVTAMFFNLVNSHLGYFTLGYPLFWLFVSIAASYAVAYAIGANISDEMMMLYLVINIAGLGLSFLFKVHRFKRLC